MSLWQTTLDALHLLVSLDPKLWEIVAVSFSVSLTAIALVLIPSVVLSFVLAYTNFRGKWTLLSLINTLQAVPTVVIGLLLYMLLSRAGPLGDWQMLFTQQAMILGQALICFPILVAMMHGALQSTDRRSLETSMTLGASVPRLFATLVWEARFPLMAATIAGFSRIVTEVGCSMMVGGNIMGLTRNIPTAISLESNKGAFAQVLGRKPWWQRLFLTSATSEVVYLHQSPYLFDDTVYQNVVYGIRFSGLSAHEKRAQVITALRMVGLETLADEHISVLSGGEKQRVAMARAWILKPSILLMDEPSASLDQESIERLVIMARDLLERGSSLVITSHQTNALTALCKKQWWIKERQLIESPLLQIVKENNDNHTNTSHASTFRH